MLMQLPSFRTQNRLMTRKQVPCYPRERASELARLLLALWV